MDSVQKAGSGHPGTAMSLAPVAYLLYQHVLRHDPADPDWLGRDRFVLSCGHSSLTLYIQLYLSGYGLTLDDLKRYREWGSLTPGHPEHGLTAGRGDHHRPAGPGPDQRGRHGHGRPPRTWPARPGRGPRVTAPSTTTSTCSSRTATSRKASATRRPRWPPTRIWATSSWSTTTTTSRSRTTRRSPSPRTWPPGTRRTAGTCSGWTGGTRTATARTRPASTRRCWRPGPVTDKPSIIVLRTIIAWPAPHAQNTGEAHGAALGEDEVAATKQVLGFDPAVNFPRRGRAGRARPEGRRPR